MNDALTGKNRKLDFPVAGVVMKKITPELVAFRQDRAKKITNAMCNKAWTQLKLADKAGHDVRTIRDLVHGKPVSNQVVVNVCTALGIEPELSPSDDDQEIEVSERWYGSYAREPYRDYEGVYFACRRSFTYPQQFVRSIIEIKWHSEDWIFVFEERQEFLSRNRKIDHSQGGEVYISQFTDLIHLVTVEAGAVRTITLTKLRGGGQIMRGAVLTQSERSYFFVPSISPIYLEKINGYSPGEHDQKVGPVKPDDDGYETIRHEIERIEQEIIVMGCPTTPPIPYSG